MPIKVGSRGVVSAMEFKSLYLMLGKTTKNLDHFFLKLNELPSSSHIRFGV